MSIAVPSAPSRNHGLAFLLGIRLLQFVVLTIVMTVAFALGGVLAGIATPQTAAPAATAPAASAAPPQENAANELAPLALVCALESAVLAFVILQSTGHGWKLIAAVFLAIYGSNTIVAQLESLVYLPAKLPAGMIPRLFVMGAIVAAIFSPLAVVILGKARAKSGGARRVDAQPSSAGSCAWKIAVIVVAYVVLYYGFGYFVAWKQPAVREFYGGTDPGTFFAQMTGIWKATPWMFGFQAMRAVLWTLLVLPLIRMLDGPVWKVGLTTALLFAVWSVQLLLPNPFMPEAVRSAHLIETLSSNLLFGLLVGSLAARRSALPPPLAAAQAAPG